MLGVELLVAVDVDDVVLLDVGEEVGVGGRVGGVVLGAAGRACPRCGSPYTVGPQTYIPTCGGLIGSKVSLRRSSVL